MALQCPLIRLCITEVAQLALLTGLFVGPRIHTGRPWFCVTYKPVGSTVRRVNIPRLSCKPPTVYITLLPRLKRFPQPTMFSTQSNRGFIPGYQNPYALGRNALGSYTQGYIGVRPNALRGWDAPAPGFGASPWAWQWGEGIRSQRVCDTVQSRVLRCTERA